MTKMSCGSNLDIINENLTENSRGVFGAGNLTNPLSARRNPSEIGAMVKTHHQMDNRTEQIRKINMLEKKSDNIDDGVRIINGDGKSTNIANIGNGKSSNLAIIGANGNNVDQMGNWKQSNDNQVLQLHEDGRSTGTNAYLDSLYYEKVRIYVSLTLSLWTL